MGEIDTRLPPRRMKVFAIIGLTTLAAVCLALPAEEHIREEVSPLWEQETSLYERMVTPSLYSQQSDLFASLVEVEAGKGKKKAKKAAPAAKKKGGKKSAKAGKSVDAKTLKKEEHAAFTAHGKEIAASQKRHNQAVLGPFQRHKTVTAAEAKAAKTQEKRMADDTKAQRKAEKVAAKKVAKGAADATARADHEWKKGVRQVWKIEHPHGKKGLAKEKRDAKFIKTMKKVSQGDAVIANGDQVYLKKGVGNVKFGKAAKKKAKKAAKKGKKAAKKGKKKVAKKKATKKKKKEITLYQQQTQLFEQMVQPRRTVEQMALDDMHDADDLAQNRYDQMFEEALKPVAEESVDEVEELVQEDKITPLSDAEERRGAQRVLFQREEELYQESMQPMHTKEEKALDEMRFAEDVMQGELTHAYNNALRK